MHLCRAQRAASSSRSSLNIHSYFRSFIRSFVQQESPAAADKPARRESMPKIASIRRQNKLQTS